MGDFHEPEHWNEIPVWRQIAIVITALLFFDQIACAVIGAATFIVWYLFFS